MTKKEIGRCIAFALVLCVVLLLLCDLFELENTRNIDMRFTTYRNLNEDTVDAVWIGTSGVDRYWVAPKAYEEYGITLYTLASDAMPTWLFINTIEEAYAYQNPELILVDLRAYGQNNSSAKTMGVRARRLLDSMELLSVNRIKTALTTAQTIHESFEEESPYGLSYLVPFIKYHTMWAEEDYRISSNLGNREHSYLGFYMNATLSVQKGKSKNVVYDADYYEELDPVAEKSLYDLIEYAKTNNIELLFVDTPQFKNEKEMGRANTVIRILEEEGMNYINYCQTDEAGNFVNGLTLDPKGDFYNDGHVNYYGADKFTATLAAYLDEHYDLPDRRNDAAVQEQWDGIYSKIKKQIKKWEEE